MKEIFRSTDPTEIAFARVLLEGEEISVVVFDENMSVFYGGIGLFPRRVMVVDDDAQEATQVLRDNGLETKA